MSGADESLQRFYDALWENAQAAFSSGAMGIDEHLRNRAEDRRRGLTVMLRLGGGVVEEIARFVEELRAIEPGQYLYSPRDFHVTVMSIRTGAVDYVSEPEQIAAYANALSEALSGAPGFAIRFAGVTATAEAVMVQGFPEADALNQIRARILETMAERGLPVRQRYSPRAAHVTVMRYREPCRNLPALTEKLRASRERFFGTCAVAEIHLVENDWYMTAEKLRVVRSYALAAEA